MLTVEPEPTPRVAGWRDQVLGMLLTAAAVTAGRTFWFDVLERLVGLRPSTGTGTGG